MTDPLTQLPNRRSLTQAVRREEERIKRNKAPLSFVLCDLDHFKVINDSKGHDAGDEVLKVVSKTLASCMRDVDFVARWGGEEFLAVLPDTDPEGAKLVAERIRRKVENQVIDVAGIGEPLKVTMTLGVATLRPGEGAEQAIIRADAALYEGKHQGRNRVAFASFALNS